MKIFDLFITRYAPFFKIFQTNVFLYGKIKFGYRKTIFFKISYKIFFVNNLGKFCHLKIKSGLFFDDLKNKSGLNIFTRN
jgi:hypothetical protein